MEQDIDARIERLLDQLENSALTESEIALVQKKIDYLKSLKG